MRYGKAAYIGNASLPVGSETRPGLQPCRDAAAGAGQATACRPGRALLTHPRARRLRLVTLRLARPRPRVYCARRGALRSNRPQGLHQGMVSSSGGHALVCRNSIKGCAGYLCRKPGSYLVTKTCLAPRLVASQQSSNEATLSPHCLCSRLLLVRPQ